MSGKRTSLKDPDLQENVYVYDNAGRLVTEQLEAGKRVYFAYDASGMLTRRHMPQNVIIAYYDYDVAGRNTVNKQKGAFLDTRVYHRNKNGAIETEDAGFSNFLYYGYDALDRLTQEKIQGAPYRREHPALALASDRDNRWSFDGSSALTRGSQWPMCRCTFTAMMSGS